MHGELPFARLVAERYRTDHHELVVDPDMVGTAAQHRAPPRRTVRGHVGGPDPVPVRGDPPPRHRRAVRRRRRRGVRWLPPLQLGPRRRFDLPAAVGAADAGHGADGAGAGRDCPLAARVRARVVPAPEAERYLRFVCHFSHAEKSALYTPALRERFATDATAARFAEKLAASARDRHGHASHRSRLRHLPARRHPDQGRHRQHDLVAGGARAVLRSPRRRAGRRAARTMEVPLQPGQADPEGSVRGPRSRSRS